MRSFVSTMVIAVLGIAVWNTTAHAQSPAIRPFVNYDHDRLNVLFRANDLKPALDRVLAQMLAQELKNGEVQSSDTMKVTIRNPQVSFKPGAITVRVDYSVQMRGWSWVPAPTIQNPGRKKKQYTPWASDSGWAEFDLQTGINNWVLHAHTRAGLVRYRSNNKFTNAIRGVFDAQLRVKVAGTINRGIAQAAPGLKQDVRQLLLTRGASAIAQKLGVSFNIVESAMRNVLGRTRLDAQVGHDGILLVASMPRSLFKN